MTPEDLKAKVEAILSELPFAALKTNMTLNRVLIRAARPALIRTRSAVVPESAPLGLSCFL